MSASQYRLVVKAGGIIGTAYALEGTEIYIGRDAQNDIVIPEADISRRHARLMRTGAGGYAIEDLGSTNGTYVRGQKITGPHALRPGDEIQVGPKVVLVYEQLSDPGATVAVAAETVQAAVQAAAPLPAAAPIPQAAPPPPPMAAVPPAPAKKKSLWWLYLLIIAAIFLCIAIGVWLWFAPASFWCAVFPFFFPGACP